MIVLAVAAAGGYALVLAALHAVHGKELRADELHHVRTGGGWEAALHRYRPRPGGEPRAVPVILAHGVAMNRRFWDMTPEISLARYLAGRGHDVWIAEYRGDQTARFEGDGRRWDFSVDDHILEDAPALIEHVRALTGAERVSWVGHSMGGIILHGYVQAFGTSWLHRTVTVGSPVRMKKGGAHLPIPSWVARAALAGRQLPLYPFTRLTLPFSVFLKNVFLGRFYAVRHTRNSEIAQLFSRGVMSLSKRLLRQFERWQRTGQMEFDDGSACIEDAPRDMDVPLLVIAGKGDRLVPPKAAIPAFELAPVEDKELWIVGDEGDDAPPLGHNDLIASENGRRWVYPRIAEWLER